MESAERDLRHVISTLFETSQLRCAVLDSHDNNEQRPHVLHSILTLTSTTVENVNLSGENIFLARNPDALFDMDVCVGQTKSWYLLDRVFRRGIRGAFPDQ